jgi:hypothetical protein
MKFRMGTMVAAILVGGANPAASRAALLSSEASAETRDVRVYFLERATPARSLKGAVASLVVERDSGESATFLLPLVEQTSPDSGREPGMIRGFVGTPYFAELILDDGKAKAGREPRSEGQTPAGPGHPPPGRLLSAEDVLRRAHRGPCFEQKIPASILSGPYQATLTIRLESQTISSEEFQSPAFPPKQAASAALRAVESLWSHVEEGGKFMDLKPLAREVMRNLAMLAPAGFKDDAGSFEQDRQWCLALGRAIEKACDEGNTGLVQNLSTQSKTRLQRMLEYLETPLPSGVPPVGESPTDSP